MLLEEAKWLGHHLEMLSADEISPMCNVGSASEEFRKIRQPYIDSYIFAPARRRGIDVLHVDGRAEIGVDVVGDLIDPTFLASLTEMNFQCVMCCNLLEHVTDRPLVCSAVMAMVRAGGYILVTVPNRFPYHEDPIDTMFRPSVAELVGLFTGCSVISAEIVRASGLRPDDTASALFWLLIRCCVPFYRPQRWFAAVRRLGEIVFGYKVTCAILRKSAQSASIASRSRLRTH